MEITNNNYIQQPIPSTKSGNVSPTSVPKSEKTSLIHDMAKNIDPSNMSRNDALEIANQLMKSGDGELSTVFLSQAITLKNNGDGTFSQADENSPEMTDKFNMFDRIKSQMAFNDQNNISNESLQKAFNFLDKLTIAKTQPAIDVYA